MPAKKKAAKKKTTKKKGTKKKATKKKPARKAAPKRKTASKRRAAPRKGQPRQAAARPKAARKPRKPNPAFMRPMTISAELSAVVGDRAIPRTEVTKKLWDYIKKNGLQDSENRRMINADERLAPIFGGRRKVSMFEMTKLVSKHLK
jgi:chromatin remodeling complex protein RSC6